MERRCHRLPTTSRATMRGISCTFCVRCSKRSGLRRWCGSSGWLPIPGSSNPSALTGVDNDARYRRNAGRPVGGGTIDAARENVGRFGDRHDHVHGTPPKMKPIDMAKEPSCAKEHATPVETETVVTGPNNTLQFVVI